MDDPYLVLKALHLIALVAWMAGLFYLPRLFVYHTSAPPGSPLSETFKVMERKLLRIIMNPAMVATWAFGGGLIYTLGADWFRVSGWLHVKLVLVILLSAFHGFLAKTCRQFARDERPHGERFYRIANEIPTLLLIGIIFLAVLKPVWGM